MTLTPAQREAYARVKTSIVYLQTLEFRHPTFGDPIRLVANKEPLTVTLEANAPTNGGEEVTFTNLAFRLKDPAVDTEAAASIRIQVDGVPGAIQTYLAAANKTIVPVDCTVRYYTYDLDADSVIDGAIGILHLQVRSFVVNKTSVGVELGFTNTKNRAFPSQYYTPETNPGLVNA